mgnify:CR=1 FL=1
MEMPFDFDLSKVTRVVVIDYDGNSYEKWNIVIDKVRINILPTRKPDLVVDLVANRLRLLR